MITRAATTFLALGLVALWVGPASRTVGVGAGQQSGAPASSTPIVDKPIIDNDRVTVWKVTEVPESRPAGDFVWVSLARLGEAAFRRGAASAPLPAGPSVIVALKDKRVPPLENRSGYTAAFPRPGVKKVLDTERVLVWDYSWVPGEPTPMHFHDKDVVVTYVADGALKSTAPDGQSTVNEFSSGTVRFNARDRIHTEVLMKGQGRAIIVELK
jgi:hypothetical protein